VAAVQQRPPLKKPHLLKKKLHLLKKKQPPLKKT